MNVSQFVLSTSLQVADEILADERIVRLSATDYDAFAAKLDEEPRDVPQLRELFAKPSVLES